MTDPKKPAALADTDLEDVGDGGLMDTKAGTFGCEPITLERGAKPYLGETEKNVWKVPAGITHSTEFEQ